MLKFANMSVMISELSEEPRGTALADYTPLPPPPLAGGASGIRNHNRVQTMKPLKSIKYPSIAAMLREILKHTAGLLKYSRTARTHEGLQFDHTSVQLSVAHIGSV